jgi:hypothetical protein
VEVAVVRLANATDVNGGGLEAPVPAIVVVVDVVDAPVICGGGDIKVAPLCNVEDAAVGKDDGDDFKAAAAVDLVVTFVVDGGDLKAAEVVNVAAVSIGNDEAAAVLDLVNLVVIVTLDDGRDLKAVFVDRVVLVDVVDVNDGCKDGDLEVVIDDEFVDSDAVGVDVGNAALMSAFSIVFVIGNGEKDDNVK